MTAHQPADGAAVDADAAAALAGARVLLGVSGGVAAYKAASLARALVTAGAQVQAVLTEAAAEFVGPATFASLTGRSVPTGVFEDAHRVLHVRLARDCDVAAVVPATADVLAKMAGGLADDLLSSTLLCVTAPVVVAPAMHAEMWQHPATADNVAALASRGVTVVGPHEGALAGGDTGAGRLADEPALLAAVAAARRRGEPDRSLAGRRAVVTAGPTREPLDPVRVLTNRSSGRMGYRLAAELARRGAAVDLVAGPGEQPDPAGVAVTRVETAQEMHAAVLDRAPAADVVVGAAAVSDYRPASASGHKLKKEAGEPPPIELVANPDILADVGARRRPDQVLVGFAAETDDAEAHGKDKLARKRLDLVVVNRVDQPDSGFEAETNRALLLDADGARGELALSTKAELAAAVVDRVVARLAEGGHPG
jgi:phosphopantothenoylcysteine decarboxylase/phosphopantothenate--cysteine ligase